MGIARNRTRVSLLPMASSRYRTLLDSTENKKVNMKWISCDDVHVHRVEARPPDKKAWLCTVLSSRIFW